MTRLESIRARAEAATKGPWRVVRLQVDDAGAEFPGDCETVECEPGEPHLYVEVRCAEPGHVAVTCDEEGATTAPDAEFIAHAREDVPHLLSLLDRAVALLGDLHVPCDKRFSADCSGCNADIAIHEFLEEVRRG